MCKIYAGIYIEVMVMMPLPVLFEIDGLVQDCSNSSALAMELLQSCSEQSEWSFLPSVKLVSELIWYFVLDINNGHWVGYWL